MRDSDVLRVVASSSGGNRILVFGGRLDGAVDNETWLWNGTAWSKLDLTESPPGRSLAALGYDEEAKVFVLFGGEIGGAIVGDTWTFDGTTWTQVFDPQPSRANVAMAWNAARRTLVLTGDGPPLERIDERWTTLDANLPSERAAAAATPHPDGTGTTLWFGAANFVGLEDQLTLRWNVQR